MRIEWSSPLAKTDNPEVHVKRLHKLQGRCLQEIRLLNKKMEEFHQQASRKNLEQRLMELQQRQQFYQAQLSRLTVHADHHAVA